MEIRRFLVSLHLCCLKFPKCYATCALKIPFFNHFETRYFTIVHVIRHLNQVNWMRFHSLFHLSSTWTFAFTGIRIQWSAIHNNVSSIFRSFVIYSIKSKPNESQSISISMNRLYKMFFCCFNSTTTRKKRCSNQSPYTQNTIKINENVLAQWNRIRGQFQNGFDVFRSSIVATQKTLQPYCRFVKHGIYELRASTRRKKISTNCTNSFI